MTDLRIASTPLRILKVKITCDFHCNEYQQAFLSAGRGFFMTKNTFIETSKVRKF